MMKKGVTILGSSRGDGNTMQAVDAVFEGRDVEVIDLLQCNITLYDYEHKNKDDDFIKVVAKMIASEVIIFATPVYWYAMSAQMKTFFDRFSDLITIRKEMGRALNGKTCYLIASGTENVLPEGFEIPFARTCEYMDMKYGGGFYCKVSVDENKKSDAQKFGKLIFEGTSHGK